MGAHNVCLPLIDFLFSNKCIFSKIVLLPLNIYLGGILFNGRMNFLNSLLQCFTDVTWNIMVVATICAIFNVSGITHLSMSDYVSFRSFNLILSELNCTMRYPILGFAACEVWWAVWVATGLILYIWNPSRLLNGSFMSLPTITANYWKKKYTNCRFLWNFPQHS